MRVSLELIKELRKKTQAGIVDCQRALKDSSGDFEKAVGVLRKRGFKLAQARQARPAQKGRVEAYIHLGNQVGVLLEVDCETDFVARNSEFCRFVKDIALQIVACQPKYIKREDVPREVVKNLKDKEGFYRESCLLEQAFIKDLMITIKDYLADIIAKLGENIIIRRFVKFKVGETEDE
ncbi:MAG: elongation factor Ts [Candidatus Omnitrophica bacterium]|nr:elongation factor Ts [Candidatus Omnitrophota bacterium]